ncbi:hypothetical protein MEQU1_001118 [Malassezia equina]|uniref:Uncharacterized protein n=1 Tax=Malassezia equina TaxID=1381935 RepID=A0AAF0IYN6_9BASI|nr:hypothetical protein MEQU1_001118 [Malassezia equina]
MALEGWHTDKPKRTKCMGEELGQTALLPAASVFQSNLKPGQNDTQLFVSTPTRDPPSLPEEGTPEGDADIDSPGMARAASPSVEAHVRRDYVREVLGDVSNLSSPAAVNCLKDHVSPLRVQSTPLRRSVHLPPTMSSAKKTPVQMALQDWAGSKFDRPLPTLDASSPSQEPTCSAPGARESLSSPIKLSTPGPPSPAERAVDPTRTAVTPVQPLLPDMPKSSPLPRIPSPEKGKEGAAGSSPSKSSRIWRPARYTSQAPAVRVWDNPEKMELHKRLRPAVQEPMEESVEPAAPKPEPAPPAARRVSTRLLKRAAPLDHRAQAQARPISEPEKVPVPTRSSTIPAMRTPRTPRTPPVPPRPQLSSTELARLTQRHTKHNEAYTVELETQIERLPGPRPPSPSQHFLLGRGMRARENYQPSRTETDEYGQPLGHAYGAGDDMEYSTPPGKQAVHWDKRLVISPTQLRPAEAQKNALPRRSCLVAKPVALDAFGNVASKPMREGPRRRVLIKRRIYDNEGDVA